jgi:hypothetical protein
MLIYIWFCCLSERIVQDGWLSKRTVHYLTSHAGATGHLAFVCGSSASSVTILLLDQDLVDAFLRRFQYLMLPQLTSLMPAPGTLIWACSINARSSLLGSVRRNSWAHVRKASMHFLWGRVHRLASRASAREENRQDMCDAFPRDLTRLWRPRSDIDYPDHQQSDTLVCLHACPRRSKKPERLLDNSSGIW